MAEQGREILNYDIKKYNNQLHGSNSLRECMVWGWCTHLGMEELVSPAIPNYCNKKGGTAVPALVALDGLTSSEGKAITQTIHKQQFAGVNGRVAPVEDVHGSFI